MKLITTFSLLLAAAAAPLLADCAPTLNALSSTNIAIGGIDETCQMGTPAPGDAVTITAGDQPIALTVVKFVPGFTVGTTTLRGTLQLASADPAPEKLQLLNNESSVSVTVGKATFTARVLSPTPNYFRYSWSIGPATTGETAGGSGITGMAAPHASATTGVTSDATSKPSTGALSLKYAAQYASSGMFGTSVGAAQTVATIDIDTTDQRDPSFIDNNRATLGFQWAVPPAGNLLKQATIGFEGRASKAIHHDIHDLDAAVTVSGWLPVIHTLNLFNREGEFISAPLSFTASYGYRNRALQSQTFRGKVFETTALYHIFAVDRYKVDLNGTLTVDDLTNRTAATPRTQRLYKATISYLADPAKGFSVMTSIEDGSAGVMLTKVRQYFVGLALSKVNFKGKN